jgi:hypothetical protein
MSKHLTMQELEDLGFKVTKSYEHDQYVTQRRKKGLIEVETTWDMPSGKFESQDLTIEEVNCISFKKKYLKKLDKILNKHIK